jgi:glycine hydroxymethyltransferase
VTTTTHKTLRGPRGGMILCKADFQQAIDRAVFPGLQGGPHVHNTAALAVALKEAAAPSFKDYAKLVVSNAKALAAELMGRGYDVVSGGTDNHLILVDLTNKNVPGKVAARALDRAGIELNYNSVPYDTRKPFDPSGIRLGSPSVSSRGMGAAEMKLIGAWMDNVITNPTDENADKVRADVRALCAKFPAPGISA